MSIRMVIIYIRLIEEAPGPDADPESSCGIETRSLIYLTFSLHVTPIASQSMTSTTRLLDRGWTFKQIGGRQGAGNDKWLKASAFPTSVHVELLHLKIIPDPVSIGVACQRDGMYSFLIVRWTSRVGCTVYV